MRPFQRHSYDDYIAKIPSPYTFIGQPEITAVSAFYGKEVHVHFEEVPYLLLFWPQRMTFTYVTLRCLDIYDTFQLIIPEPVEQPHAPISGGDLSSAS